MGDVTQLLAQWAQGDRRALDSLTSAVYSELRKIADGYLRRERSGHTLQPTALVHEAWMRLVKQHQTNFENRKQFYALAAQIMRQILVDHARSVRAEKRGGGAPKVELHEALGQPVDHVEAFLALDQALTELSRWSPRQAQVIEMRYFGGLNVEEAAELLGVSNATISREQRTAEAWLSHAMSAETG
ncbi:MAG: RNA polymerase subunit sigma-70 [Terriglobia bacterium]|nr:MAG: RNA polymerase subunit sigma-70 [Terriglobia bacterium]